MSTNALVNELPIVWHIRDTKLKKSSVSQAITCSKTFWGKDELEHADMT
ncbi:hypothetical protein AB6E21_22915 [Photobacterium swingsii]